MRSRHPDLGESLLTVGEMSQDEKDMLLLAAVTPCPTSPSASARRCTGEPAGFFAGVRDRGWTCDPDMILMLVEAGADPNRTFWALRFSRRGSRPARVQWTDSSPSEGSDFRPYSAATQLSKGRCYRSQMAALAGHPRLRDHVQKGMAKAPKALTKAQAANANRVFKRTIDQVNREAANAEANRRAHEQREKEAWRQAWRESAAAAADPGPSSGFCDIKRAPNSRACLEARQKMTVPKTDTTPGGVELDKVVPCGKWGSYQGPNCGKKNSDWSCYVNDAGKRVCHGRAQ